MRRRAARPRPRSSRRPARFAVRAGAGAESSTPTRTVCVTVARCALNGHAVGGRRFRQRDPPLRPQHRDVRRIDGHARSRRTRRPATPSMLGSPAGPPAGGLEHDVHRPGLDMPHFQAERRGDLIDANQATTRAGARARDESTRASKSRDCIERTWPSSPFTCMSTKFVWFVISSVGGFVAIDHGHAGHGALDLLAAHGEPQQRAEAAAPRASDRSSGRDARPSASASIAGAGSPGVHRRFTIAA